MEELTWLATVGLPPKNAIHVSNQESRRSLKKSHRRGQLTSAVAINSQARCVGPTRSQFRTEWLFQEHGRNINSLSFDEFSAL